MALDCDAASAAVTRTTAMVAASSDYTCTFWFQPRPLSAPTVRVVWLVIDDPAVDDDSIGLFINSGSTAIYLEIQDNGVLTTSASAAISEDAYSAIAYVRSGTTHTLYVNGASVATLTQSVSGLTLGQLWMGSDSFTSLTDAQYQYVREWSSALTLAQVIAEWNSPTPMVTTNLVTDTPLVSDYTDDSGNGNDWTAVGAPTFETGPLPLPATNIIDGTNSYFLTPGASYCQVAREAGGTTRSLAYAYTAAAYTVFSVWPTGGVTGASTYSPVISAFTEAAWSNVYKFILGNSPVQEIPVEAGATIYVGIIRNSGNPPAALWLRTYGFTQQSTLAGALIIQDATAEWPAVILSETDGEPQRFVGTISGGDDGYKLPGGPLMYEDREFTDTRLYDTNLNLIASGLPYTTSLLSGNKSDRLYIGQRTGSVGTIDVFDTTGTPVETLTLPGSTTELNQIAGDDPSNIIYVVLSVFEGSIKRFEISSQTYLSDLAAGVSGYTTKELLWLNGNSLLAVYQRTSPLSGFIRRYDCGTGAILNTYTLADFWDQQVHLADAFPYHNPATQFWAWYRINEDTARIRLYNVDGTIATEFERDMFFAGEYMDAVNDATTETPKFGFSACCTLIVMEEPLGPTPEPTPTYAIDTLPIRRLRRAPVIHQDDEWIFHKTFQLDLDTGIGLDGATTTQGHDPQIMLRWSNDGGRTWSNEHWVSAGKLGDYSARATWRRLGRARNRVYEVVVSDPNAWAIVAAYLSLDKGTS